MVAQWIVDNSGQPAIDDGTTATLEANLTAGIVAQITAFTNNALGSGGITYNPQFGSLSVDAMDPASGSGQFRIKYGNYGIIFRNDGANFYMLLTPSGSTNGSFNTLRPLWINLSTGAISFDGTGVGSSFGGNISAPSVTLTNGTVTGTLTAGGVTTSGLSVNGNESVAGTLAANQIDANNETIYGTLNVGTVDVSTLAVSSLATAPTPPNTGQGGYFGGDSSQKVVTTNAYSSWKSSNGLTGFCRLPNGLLMQWGTFGYAASLNNTQVYFPISFNQVLAICSTDDGLSGNSSVHVTSCSADSSSTFRAYANNPATNSPAATNLGWIAIGW